MENQKKRYTVIDLLRGLTIISMITYHAVWDLVYMFQKDWDWYTSIGGYLWQQSICWTFILLSGFCFSLGKKKLKRGLVVFGAGALVTAISLLFVPENRVIFGVLTMLGSCMLLATLFEKLLLRIKPAIGLSCSILLFILTRNVEIGELGFEGLSLLHLPGKLYANLFTTYLGFPSPSFYSTDYFGLFPWIFLFLTGFFLYKIAEQKELLQKLPSWKLPVINFIGKHSLIVYLLHQPILYAVFTLFL